ncbi:Ferritin [Klebsormidium nitens]|uniref:Ferritin n=1 Tax=Klebsormidium nitens TaxID=105231 RepID=A0A1Y1I4I9_KLENI|nr:Ferritin [Klebsormidium nitens]|eukprot:GAQ85854.1 Ferritin [Klebsormidium nitens]
MAASAALLSGSAVQLGAPFSSTRLSHCRPGTAATAPLVPAFSAVSWGHATPPLPARRPSAVRAQEVESKEATLTGVVFEPFQEVQGLVKSVPETSQESFARQRFSQAAEAGINEQINVEYNNSYIYHALAAYFDRDNVALPGLAKFFRQSALEEREHAEMFIKYQNIRGGRVKLQSILAPQTEYDHSDKGDALYAMELALCLEKLTNEKLLALHKTAEESDDPQMTDFIEGNFLEEQVEAIKQVSEYVSQLRRVGKGHGVFHFDLQLQEALEHAA